MEMITFVGWVIKFALMIISIIIVHVLIECQRYGYRKTRMMSGVRKIIVVLVIAVLLIGGAGFITEYVQGIMNEIHELNAPFRKNHIQ